MNQDEFFAGGTRTEPVVAGRYRLPHPDTGQTASWQRASNFAYPLADQFGLTRWRHRQILLGLAARPDLLQLLSVLPAGDPDNSKLDEMLTTALEVAGTTVEANRGTAVHEALRAADTGQHYPAWAQPHVSAYHAELVRHGLEVVRCETLVLNLPLGAAGRFDRVFFTADGRYVIGDIKTTGHLDAQALEAAVQMAVYATATHIEGEDEQGQPKGVFSAMPYALDPDEAVLIHVDRDTGATAVYRVDLRLGRYGANLAEQVRSWRQTKGVLLPYVRPAGDLTAQLERSLAVVPAPAAVTPSLVDVDQVAQRRAALHAVPDSPVSIDEPADQTDANDQPDSAGVQPGPRPTPIPTPVNTVNTVNTVGSPADQAGAPADRLALKTADELMKLDKAHLQQYGRERGVTDLAHTRKVLVEIFTQAGIVAGSGNENMAQQSQDRIPDDQSATQPAVQHAGPPAPTDDPDDPRTQAFRSVVLARITVAATVTELAKFHRSVVSQYGYQAWTDELTEAARVRVEQLDTQHDAQDMFEAIAAGIAACQSSHDLARLWEDVTVGGSAPARWTDEVQNAALARMAQIKAEQQPAPSNPFG